MARDTSLAVQSLIDKSVDAPESLSAHLPFLSQINDQTIMLRDGDLMTSFAVDGLAAKTTNESDIETLSQSISDLIAQQYGDVGFYVHRISSKVQPHLDPVAGEGTFAAQIDGLWQAHLRSAQLRHRTTVFTLTMRPSKITGLFDRFRGGKTGSAERIARRFQRLNDIASSFIEIAGPARPRRLMLSSGEWLGLLRAMLTGDFALLRPSRAYVPLNDLVATTPIHFQDDSFTIFGTHSGTTKAGTILTLRDYPAETYAGILDLLDLGIDMCVTNSFTPQDPVSAQADIRRVIRQMSVADDAAVSLQMQLNDALDDVASGRVAFGKHHCTIALYADDQRQLDENISAVDRVLTGAGASVLRENFSARPAYFAQVPGNYSYRTRASSISSLNFAHLSALHGSARGLPKESTYWGEAITILPTANGEPYRFNFHLPGSSDSEPVVGHSLVLGRTGSGKTLGTAFLLAQAQRLSTRLIVFDKDRGFEMAIRALGGSYNVVQVGTDTGFNPFTSEADERGSAWLADWLESLLKPKDGELTPIQIESLGRACAANRSAEDNLQTMGHFRSQFRSTNDGGDLHQRLGRWDRSGQFGWLFNGEGRDSLTFENDITAFDVTEIFDNPQTRTAWLSYVFRRIERTVEDKRPTLIVLDEAWKLLDDDYFRTRLKDWMLTMRKKNVAVVLLTQQAAHITESAAGSAILSGIATLLIYPSNKSTRDELAPLRLTDNELGFAVSSNVGHRLALIRSGDASIIVDMNLAPLGSLLKVLGGGNGEGAPQGWREDPDFWKGIE
ncbi:type IV secretion protein [Roseibium sp. HPY-6]|uniref:VirB4 family type IV secretion/conjugal transfer ATPase n=1 Tax=Roseibium sp. HPY-6 TaxID=3229852 RepID=UPI00339052EF